MWKFYGKAQFPHSFGDSPKLCGNCAFTQNFHNRKLGEITVFYEVPVFDRENNHFSKILPLELEGSSSQPSIQQAIFLSVYDHFP